MLDGIALFRFSLPRRVPGSANIFRSISSPPFSIPRFPFSLTHAHSRKASSAFIIFPHFYLVPFSPRGRRRLRCLRLLFFSIALAPNTREMIHRALGTLRSLVERVNTIEYLREHDMRGIEPAVFH